MLSAGRSWVAGWCADGLPQGVGGAGWCSAGLPQNARCRKVRVARCLRGSVGGDGNAKATTNAAGAVEVMWNLAKLTAVGLDKAQLLPDLALPFPRGAAEPERSR